MHKCTGLTAARFGIADRGVIREGAFADLARFDPDTVIDSATFAAPARPAAGIAETWVNGVPVYRIASAAGRPGRARGG